MKNFTLNKGSNQSNYTSASSTFNKLGKSFLFGMFFMLMTSITAYADSGIFQTYAIINSGSGNQFYAGGINSDGASLIFNNTNLGSYCPGGTLILNGGEAKTYKNGISDVFGANIYYRIYSTSGSAGSFNQIPLLFNTNLVNSGDQKWQTSGHNVNVLNGLTAGTYYLEVYWDASTSDSTKFDTNFGNNFKATFTVLPPALSAVVTNATCNGGNNGAINLSVSCTPTAAPITQTYAQDFNTLATTGTTNTWTDNSTITNWYTNRSVYIASAGTSTAGGLYSFGTGTTTERALGSIGSNGVPSILGAVKITNTTGQTVNSITVSYTGEQWRNGGNTAASKLDFTYAINATDEAIGTYNDVNALDFVSPIVGATAAALDGNVAPNRTAITATFAVSIPAGSSIWLRWQDVDDTGSDHGLAIDDLTATLSAPATGVSYLWSPGGATTEDISGLIAGNYTVTVSGSSGSSTATYNVGQPAVIAVTESHTAILCKGGISTVTISATGGTGTLSGTGNFTQSAGTKSYTVTDANGCTKSISVTVDEPTLLVATENHTAIVCKGGTSTVTIGATGGTAPYSGIGDFTQSAGTQSYTITDANGCTKSISVTVTEPALLVATESHTPILCKGGSSTVTIGTTGGTGTKSGIGNFTQSVGTQLYTVTDANGCSSTISVEVTEPLLLEVSTTQTDVSCYGGNNGAIDLSVSGGTPFNTGGTVNYAQNFNTLASSGTSTIIPAGWFFIESGTNTNTTYTAGTGSSNAGDTFSFGTTSSDRALGTLRSGSLVSTIGAGSTFINTTGATVTSLSIQYTGEQWRLGESGGTADKLDFQYSTNATAINNGTWTDVDALDFSSPVVSGTVGALDGNAIANRTIISNTISGLSIPNNATFWIRWNDSDVSGADDGLGIDDFSMTMNSATTPYTYAWTGNGVNSTTQDQSGLTAGTYGVVVTDANGCTATTSVTVSEPTQVVASVVVTQPKCFGESGTVVVSATGGTGSYGSTVGSFTVAAGDSYSYTVTDSNGCTSNIVSGTIDAPTAVVASAVVTQPKCFGESGTVVVSAIGGTGSYGSTVGSFTVAAGDSYSYTVTDSNGCTSNTVSGTIDAPTAVVASAVVTQPKCFGESGTVEVSAIGGTGSYGESVGSFTVAAGDSYSYTVTDSNGCTSNIVSGTIDAPTAVVASVVVTQPKCFGESGTVVVSATGGTGSYGSTVGTFTVAAGGSYSYTVTDSNGCTSNIVSGTIDAPTVLVASSSTTAIQCNGGTSTVTVSATGGTEPYSGIGTFTVGAGNYSYIVTDANGCTSTTTGTITQPDALVATETHTAILCNGGTSSVTIAATGGTGPYSGTGPFSQSAGTETYTVTDANGCSKSVSVTVTEPSVLSAKATSNNPILYYGYAGDQTALVTTTVTGGTAPYKVTATMSRPLNCNIVTTAGDELWVPGAGTIMASNVNTVCPSTGTGLTPSSTGDVATSGGIYSVTVSLMADAVINFTITDANGCTTTSSQAIEAEDVRCFAGNSTNTKITICHKTGSTKNPCVAICVDYSALQEHLDHGDYVGACTKTCVAPTNAKHIEVEETAVFKVTAYPNPSRSQFTLLVEGNKNEKVEVMVYDMMARMIKRIEKIDGEPILFGEELPAGEYLTIVKQGENMKAVNVIKQ